MNLLNPRVVFGSRGLGYMVFELDDVGVGDLFGRRRREYGSSTVMDGFIVEGRGCEGRGYPRKSDKGPHDDRVRCMTA
ncbi:hypothetical protein RRF57_008035 [Xylaria bambusicola]|uniref:Uncharacterized protein n=1 Tax=Xylaria bambusicola TaxID=326684 RepID=A0AAN7UNP7_9PEZI